jgi:uncharacterized protein YdaU (DUF1376 family)
MHHYPFHVGDYIRATAHLDIIEDCIYRRLIDLYMETEQPIPNETQQVIRRLRLGSSGLILETILKEFFTIGSDNCWHNSRCDAEILEYKRLAEVSRANGKLGGRPKKTQRVILANPAITQQEPSRLQPRTNNQEPITNIKEHAAAFALPDWVDKTQWDLWMKTRKGKKMIPAQMQAQVAKLGKWRDEGLDYCGALANAAANGYTGLFLPDNGKPRKTPPPENFSQRDYGTGVQDL